MRIVHPPKFGPLSSPMLPFDCSTPLGSSFRPVPANVFATSRHAFSPNDLQTPPSFGRTPGHTHLRTPSRAGASSEGCPTRTEPVLDNFTRDPPCLASSSQPDILVVEDSISRRRSRRTRHKRAHPLTSVNPPSGGLGATRNLVSRKPAPRYGTPAAIVNAKRADPILPSDRAPDHDATEKYLRAKMGIKNWQPLDLSILPDPPNPLHPPDAPLNSLMKLAIFSAPDHKLKVAEIYEALENRFEYFKSTEVGWKGNVRHYLSSRKEIFRRIAIPGLRKTGYWTLDLGKIKGKKHVKVKPRQHLEDASSLVGEPGSMSGDWPICSSHVCPASLNINTASAYAVALPDRTTEITFRASSSLRIHETSKDTTTTKSCDTIAARAHTLSFHSAPDERLSTPGICDKDHVSPTPNLRELYIYPDFPLLLLRPFRKDDQGTPPKPITLPDIRTLFHIVPNS